ncbi:MAG: SIS domain-containing protein [Alphaproteobacteria bacterium]|nr:SIS domain-containing protein [Alphaproteobacteria bacterium]
MTATDVTAYLQRAAALINESAAATRAGVERAIELLAEAALDDKPILVCGNGGSAADSMHIAGELVGRFLKERRALNCRSLAADPAILTAWSNDYAFDDVFARQVDAYGATGGVLIAISTSGNSGNVIKALGAARRRGMATIGLTGEGGGKMAGQCDALIAVPSRITPEIQQVHICLYHYICQKLEERVVAGGA